MTRFVTSQDGTRIAYDRTGEGPPVVLIGGMFCHRPRMQALAAQLSRDLAVVNYDRRGRGESGDTAPYAVEREVEDLAALVAAIGEPATLYGHSSGAALALRAAAAGLPVARLALHEPPYGADDEDEVREARAFAGRIRDAIAEGRRGDAIALFLGGMGMPEEAVRAMREAPPMLAVADTMPYDLDVTGSFDRGGVVPAELARAVRVPTLVIAGSGSPAFFRDTATRLVGLLPSGRLEMLEGADHGAPAEVVAPVVRTFVAGEARG